MAQNTTNYGFPYPEDADPVDVAGDIQALAEDIDTNLGEIIADTVGDMVDKNTESGISVTYDDSDNTLDFNVDDFDITLLGDVSGSASIVNLASASISVSVIDDSHNHSSSTITDFSEAVADTVGNMVTSNTENGISVTYDDADNTLDFDVEDFDITLIGDVSGSASIINLASASVNVTVIDDSHNHSSSTITDLNESVADIVGAMVSSNTENGISVTYDDADNTLDFDVEDFDIVLSGDVSGSATVTNLSNINISASVTDNSHNHVAANITDFETAVDSVVDSFANIDVPTGTDPAATAYNDTLYITESNGVLVNGAGSNTIDISTNATPLNTASAIVSRDSEKTFDITGIDFDTSASATSQVGRMVWDDGEGTLKVNLKGGNVDLDIGQENVVLCYNGSGSALSIGDVIYVQGAQGQKPDITLASASAESSSSKTLGIVAEAISAGGDGFVTTFGMVKGVNTFGFTEGAALWLSTTPGGFTQTPPTTPDHSVFVGYCLKASSSAGRIFVQPQNGYEIQELHNVLITSATANDVLIYNSASGIWINEDISDIINSASAVNAQNINISGDLDVTGTITGDITGNVTGNADTATALETSRTIALAGDVSGSASFDGTSDITISATVQADSVALGTDTTGDYVESVTGTANEIEVSGTGEGATVQIGLPNDVQISNDLTVGGDLTVSGSVIYLNTEQLYVEDNIVVLNSNVSGSPSVDAGIEIERGTADNVLIRWNESSDVWEFTTDGTTYYEIQDFDTSLATKTTDNLTEGSTNLYFTNQRALDATTATIASASAAAVAHADALDTDDVAEGSTNLYFTDERAQDATAAMITSASHVNISVLYDDVSNTLTFTGASGYGSTDFNTDFATKDTDDLTEGSTNLYFTNQRAIDATLPTITSASANALSEAQTYADALDTDDVSEGSTNLYFTDERAQDAAADMIVNGSHTNISVTYNDVTNTLDLAGSASAVSLTSEQIQDTVAPLFTHSNHTNITATYDDANDEILLQASGGGASLSSGSAYPTSSITNGDLFYNTTSGRTAIYFDTVWKEFAYVTDSPSDGGTPSTTTFTDSYEGGDASTSIFVGAFDGGSA